MNPASEALKKLDEIEAEMRRIGCWSAALEAESGKCETGLRSAMDAPSLQIWLQRLFLPNARAAAREGKLPARSQAGEIAGRHYASSLQTPEGRKLLELVRDFDVLCRKASSPESA